MVGLSERKHFKYYEKCLNLKRKYNTAQEILKWVRPVGMKIRPAIIKWDIKQDEYIFNHSIEESMVYLNRTKQSIQNRMWRLKNNKIYTVGVKYSCKLQMSY